MRALILCFLLPFAAKAECTGQNLIGALPADQRAAITEAAMAVPFPQGNLWQAVRGGQRVTIIGTYHLDDPRHDALVAGLRDDLDAAKLLLVEAGPEEEAAMKAELASNPDLLLNQDGPTLPEALPEQDWARVSQALAARGIPAFFGAKLQPWYLSTLLAIPACQMADLASQNGLDRRLMAEANARNVPVLGLEPFDTVFTIFDAFTPEEQIDMLMQTLDTAGEGDMAVTLSDSYFAGENRLFWEFSRLQVLNLPGADPVKVAREFDMVEQALMIGRNRAWIPVIEAEAAKGALVVAVGALHLSGEQGVLNLLAQGGWSVTPLQP